MKRLTALLVLIASVGAAYAKKDLTDYGFAHGRIAASAAALPAAGKPAQAGLSGEQNALKVKALAREHFFGRDARVELGKADYAGELYGEVKVWHSGAKWVTVKKYLAASLTGEGGLPDSPQAIKSAQEYVKELFKADTVFQAVEIPEGICGGEGPSFVVEVFVKDVAESVKTYGIPASELPYASPSLMASDECRE